MSSIKGATQFENPLDILFNDHVLMETEWAQAPLTRVERRFRQTNGFHEPMGCVYIMVIPLI
jgi:hypothetical protein